MDNSSSEWYNRPMKDFNDNVELTGDLLDEYLAIQEAELAQEQEEDEYTEEDAFLDFIAEEKV